MSDAPIPSTADLLYQDRQNFNMPQFQLQQTPQIQAQFAPPAQSPVFSLPQTAWTPPAPQFQPAAFQFFAPQLQPVAFQPSFMPMPATSFNFQGLSAFATPQQMGTDIFGAPPQVAAPAVEPSATEVAGLAIPPVATPELPAPAVTAFALTPDELARDAWQQTLALERLDERRAPPPSATPSAPEVPAAPTALDRIGALNLKRVASDAISPGTDAEAELARIQTSIRDLGARPSDPEEGLSYDSNRTMLQREEARFLGVISGRRAFETAVNSGMQTYPELLDAVPAGQDLTVVGLTDAVRASLQERFAPLMATPGLAEQAQAALSVFDVSAGSAIKEPSGVASLFSGYGSALSAGARAIETYLADELGVPRTPSGSGGIFSESDLARIERGIDYVKEHGLAEAFPTVLASLEGRKTRAEDAISVANGTAGDATKLLSEYDVGLRASVSKWAHGDEALEVAEAQLTPLRSNFKLQVEAIKASGKTPAQQKADIAEAATQYNSAARAVLSQVGRSERPSNNPFRRSTYAADSWNWEGVMAAGGLALALYGPFERRESERRAEKRYDKQWEKEKEWQREQMALTHGYRLEQIGAQGEATRPVRQAPGALKA